jgi:hypothetical protein
MARSVSLRGVAGPCREASEQVRKDDRGTRGLQRCAEAAAAAALHLGSDAVDLVVLNTAPLALAGRS